MARAMVINYGFSEIGPFSLLDPSAQVGAASERLAGLGLGLAPAPRTRCVRAPAPSHMAAGSPLPACRPIQSSHLTTPPLSLPHPPHSTHPTTPCSPRT